MAKRIEKIGEIKTGDEKEFKGSGVEGEKGGEQGTGIGGQVEQQTKGKIKTSMLTISGGKAVRRVFEDGELVAEEVAGEDEGR